MGGNILEFRNNSSNVVSKLKDITPNETEIKFGVKLTANAGIVFSSLGSELTFEITVKWNNKTA
ncbi:MAG: CU044_2847 family protein [Dolichospermum sp.]